MMKSTLPRLLRPERKRKGSSPGEPLTLPGHAVKATVASSLVVLGGTHAIIDWV